MDGSMAFAYVKNKNFATMLLVGSLQRSHEDEANYDG